MPIYLEEIPVPGFNFDYLNHSCGCVSHGKRFHSYILNVKISTAMSIHTHTHKLVAFKLLKEQSCSLTTNASNRSSREREAVSLTFINIFASSKTRKAEERRRDPSLALAGAGPGSTAPFVCVLRPLQACLRGARRILGVAAGSERAACRPLREVALGKAPLLCDY